MQNSDTWKKVNKLDDSFHLKKISWYFTTRTHLKNIPGVRNLGKLRHRPVGSCISSPESVTSRPMIRKLQCDALKRHQRLPKLLVHLWMAPVQGCSTNPDIRRFNLRFFLNTWGEKRRGKEMQQRIRSKISLATKLYLFNADLALREDAITPS